MIIQSHDISMEGRRTYKQKATVTVQQTRKAFAPNGINALSTGVSGDNGMHDGFLGTLNYYLDSAGKLVSNDMEEVSGVDKENSANGVGGSNINSAPDSTKIQFRTLSYLLYIFFLKGKRAASDELRSILEENNSTSVLSEPMLQEVTTEKFYSYAEEETTSFSTQGKVVTEDGQEIEFGIEVGMSRSFYQEVYQKNVSQELTLCDPLIINLNGNPANVSDQKFFFDLDCDGERDNISMLGEGSGFLALDRNKDGIINDGSELFGTKSGNGFYDLAQYDQDRNGWIDEADEIFERLQIWIPNEDGTGTCYKLKDKDVGAICLQNVATDFTLQDRDQQINGAIRRSGIFLTESGTAGTIQHVDLAM